MSKARLEAFSDGVIAILITIMVLELKTPAGHDWAALREHTFLIDLLSYVLSFFTIAIYWNNHHHMLHACSRVDGAVLWANTFLLFWLSLIPFTTRWMADSEIADVPTAIYGFVLFMAGMGWNVLKITLIRRHGADSTLAKAVGDDFKGRMSGVVTGIAVLVSLVSPYAGLALYWLVNLTWLIPDKRVEKLLAD